MTGSSRYSRGLFLVLILLLLLPCIASAKSKPETPDLKPVDSGSFGIYVNGRRAATEVFSIRQGPDGSITHSDLKLSEGDGKVSQSADLELGPTGDLRRYTWSQQSGGSASAVVEPNNGFLVEHVFTEAGAKPIDQPYILSPSTTLVLDDYFYVEQQVLAWRYLASGCRPVAENLQCQFAKANLGVLLPRERTSALVSMEYAGMDSVKIYGADRNLHRFNLQSEDSQWSLWLDDMHHLVRILIADKHTEVLRDPPASQ